MWSNEPQENRNRITPTLSFWVLADLDRKLQNTIAYAKKLIVKKEHSIFSTDGDMATGPLDPRKQYLFPEISQYPETRNKSLAESLWLHIFH